MARDEKRGMEAVASKVNGKKRPVMAKKGKAPGMAVMIAIGGPKRGMREEDGPMRSGYRGEPRSSVDSIIAKLEARIAKLEAEHEEMKRGKAMDREMDEEYEDEYEDEED